MRQRRHAAMHVSSRAPAPPFRSRVDAARGVDPGGGHRSPPVGCMTGGALGPTVSHRTWFRVHVFGWI
jgi:hypothetical protein